MNISHLELHLLYNTILPEEIRASIVAFNNEVQQQGDRYECKSLWIADQTIGVIGGYCMPANPVKNPFPGGPKRELYRPLQYARSEIEGDIRLHARYAVQMCGMHLESVCRLYLKSNRLLGTFRFCSATLGKAVNQLKGINEIDPTIVEGLFNFVKVYNRSKHEVNQDDSKERLFNSCDAVVAYFSARILGLYILKILNVSESFDCFKINEETD